MNDKLAPYELMSLAFNELPVAFPTLFIPLRLDRNLYRRRLSYATVRSGGQYNGNSNCASLRKIENDSIFTRGDRSFPRAALQA